MVFIKRGSSPLLIVLINKWDFSSIQLGVHSLKPISIGLGLILIQLRNTHTHSTLFIAISGMVSHYAKAHSASVVHCIRTNSRTVENPHRTEQRQGSSNRTVLLYCHQFHKVAQPWSIEARPAACTCCCTMSPIMCRLVPLGYEWHLGMPRTKQQRDS